MRHNETQSGSLTLTQLEMNKPFLRDARQMFSPVTSCLCGSFSKMSPIGFSLYKNVK